MNFTQWTKKNALYIYIFNVGRGISIFIRLPNSYGIIYDLGGSDEFSPLDFIKENFLPYLVSYGSTPIAQLILSHPHFDHISEIDKYSDYSVNGFSAGLITCPNDKEQNSDKSLLINMGRIRRDDNKTLIDSYQSLYQNRNLPLQSISAGSDQEIANLEYGLYFVKPGIVDQIESIDTDYINGLSIIFYLKYGNQNILIPGDITPSCLDEILHDSKNIEKRYTYFYDGALHPTDFSRITTTQPSLGRCLQNGLSILVTPHHGLESCFSSELFYGLPRGKTGINVLSEKRHLSDSDGSISEKYYSSDYCNGSTVDNNGTQEVHNAISTRSGHILIIMDEKEPSPIIIIRSNPNDLLHY